MSNSRPSVYKTIANTLSVCKHWTLWIDLKHKLLELAIAIWEWQVIRRTLWFTAWVEAVTHPPVYQYEFMKNHSQKTKWPFHDCLSNWSNDCLLCLMTVLIDCICCECFDTRPASSMVRKRQSQLTWGYIEAYCVPNSESEGSADKIVSGRRWLLCSFDIISSDGIRIVFELWVKLCKQPIKHVKVEHVVQLELLPKHLNFVLGSVPPSAFSKPVDTLCKIINVSLPSTPKTIAETWKAGQHKRDKTKYISDSVFRKLPALGWTHAECALDTVSSRLYESYTCTLLWCNCTLINNVLCTDCVGWFVQHSNETVKSWAQNRCLARWRLFVIYPDI